MAAGGNSGEGAGAALWHGAPGCRGKLSSGKGAKFETKAGGSNLENKMGSTQWKQRAATAQENVIAPAEKTGQVQAETTGQAQTEKMGQAQAACKPASAKSARAEPGSRATESRLKGKGAVRQEQGGVGAVTATPPGSGREGDASLQEQGRGQKAANCSADGSSFNETDEHLWRISVIADWMVTRQEHVASTANPPK